MSEQLLRIFFWVRREPFYEKRLPCLINFRRRGAVPTTQREVFKVLRHVQQLKHLSSTFNIADALPIIRMFRTHLIGTASDHQKCERGAAMANSS